MPTRMPISTLVASALMFFAVLAILPPPAHAADGFVCKSVDEDVLVTVVLAPQRGTGGEEPARKGHVMIVSAPDLEKGRQTIARFQAKEGMLSGSGSVFIGFVKPRHPDTGQKGKRIGGTTLGQLRTLILDIDYSPDLRGRRDQVPWSAQLFYIKHNGDDFVQDFDCVYKPG